MAGNGARPDLLVSVDFGMTCTGVAYVNFSTGSDRVNWIYSWPTRRHNAADKVPTVLVYDSASPQIPVAWGFGAEGTHARSPGCVARDWFKILLDPVQLKKEQQSDPVYAPKSIEQVEKWYEDYLRALYAHIEESLATKLAGKSWRQAVVHFIFSLPTTWEDKATVERFRSIIQRAGFKRPDAPGHEIEIGLTEAEAAAVHVFSEDTRVFKPGDTMLICDAGGGTSDLSVLKVEGISGGRLSLQQLLVVNGQNIGSVQINLAFCELVEARLRQAVATRTIALSDADIELMSEMAMRSADFESTKCSFGSPDYATLQTFDIAMPRLPPNYANPVTRIANQAMRFDKSEFQQLFDKQIDELCQLIDTQLNKLHQMNAGHRLNHLILSGGLGNSAYVMTRLKARYELGGPSRAVNISDLRVRIAPKPQLSVCIGICEDRKQKLLTGGQSILGWRCCRESYGVICKEKYNERNPEHHAREKQLDPVDGKYYVVDGVEWFVTVNKAVSSDYPIEKDFFRNVLHPNGDMVFNSRIFVCKTPEARFLPQHKTTEVHQVCSITSDLRSIPRHTLEMKNRSCWSRLMGRQKMYVVRYKIRAIVGPADLRFELYYNGQKMNVDNAISVEWQPANAPMQAGMNGYGMQPAIDAPAYPPQSGMFQNEGRPPQKF